MSDLINRDVPCSAGQQMSVVDGDKTDFSSLEENIHRMQMEFLQQLDSSYIKTISMTELYENVFISNPPIIDGLLYPGTYLFVGAPKLGKAFL